MYFEECNQKYQFWFCCFVPYFTLLIPAYLLYIRDFHMYRCDDVHSSQHQTTAINNIL